jgi:hypothetical protein
MKRFALSCLLVLAPFASAQTTPVLVPVFYNGPGSFGSEWFTSVSVNNFTGQRIEGHGLEFVVICPIPEGCEREDLHPDAVGRVAGPQLPSGFLLHIPAGETDRVELDARFGEITRNQYGVELPIAREDDFRRTPLVLPSVALTGYLNELRTTVRVYSPDAIAGQQVRVELRSWVYPNEVPPYGSLVVTLASPDPPGTPQPLHPAYAAVELQREFPNLFSGAIYLRIVPLPMPDGTVPRIWAMATAVRNDNNEVAVFSPR